MGYKMKSGNGPLPFKQMGSSPAKQSVAESDSTRVAKPITPKILPLSTFEKNKAIQKGSEQTDYAEDFFKNASKSAVSGTVEGGKMGLMEKAGKLEPIHKTPPTVEEKPTTKPMAKPMAKPNEKKEEKKYDLSEATVSGSNKSNTIKTRGKNQNASKIKDSAERSEIDVAKSDRRARNKKAKHAKRLAKINSDLD